MNPTYGECFAGIGGMSLGLDRAGWECRWQIEKDEFCQKVLAKHWPDVKRYGDIKSVDGNELEWVDLVAGGFPCQPVARGGKRKVQEDPRWLSPELLRIVRGVRPTFVLLENVPGLLDVGFGDVLGGVAALGYDAVWSVLPACAVGAPHTRERLFVVAYPASMGWFERWWLEQSKDCDPKRHIRDGWAEPEPCRVDHGATDRVVRNHALGNAVVPQVAQLIGERLRRAWEIGSRR